MKVLTQMATLLFCLIVFSGIALAQINTEYAQINEKVDEQVNEKADWYVSIEQTADGSTMLVNNEHYTQVAEDTDIMATIIDKTMEKIFPGEYRESGFFDAGCQGIFLKGYGVLFMMDVGFTVVKPTEDKPVKETKPDNLWDQTKRELKEGSFAYTYGSPTSDDRIGTNPTSYDQKKVEQLKDELLRLIGDYSNNIRNLQSDDNITIVIKGGKMNIMGIMSLAGAGSQAIPYPVTYIKKNEYGVQAMPDLATPPNTFSSGTAEAGVIPSIPASPPSMSKNVTAEAPSGNSSTDTMPTSPPPPKPEASTGISAVVTSPKEPMPIVTTWATRDPMRFAAAGGAIGQKGSRSTMIITVKKGNVTDLKEGRINSDEFAKRAEIIQY
jgi:hypothetical protein